MAKEPGPSEFQDEKSVDNLVSCMTLEEKLSLIHADSKFTSAAVSRLGIPRRHLSDGPHGVREEISPNSWDPAGHTDDFSTAMPAGICLAATWDTNLAFSEGKAIGEEARARGKDIMLGPGVNIMRTPLGGRNFEYFGEDPFLTSRLAVGYIRGEQSEDVSSCVKHFALNNQEYERGSINVEVDERTLREIYLPAFKAAVKEAGVWSVMAAYNRFNGQYCGQNNYLLQQILKKEWGFQGLVVSDWGGVHSTARAAQGGLDLEMGTQGDYADYYFAQPYLKALKAGKLSLSDIDDKVRRNLRVMYATHVFDPDRKTGSINTTGHQSIARQVAEEGVVLLKNRSEFLPLNLGKIHSIAVIGDNAIEQQCHGGASSEIKALYEITPLQGISRRAGKQVNITFSEGYRKNGDSNLLTRAVAAARSADVVIYIGGLNHDLGFDCEGADRKDLKLPYGQDLLIRKLVEANPRTVVVLDGTVVEMGSWLDKVPALLQAWYPGMEGGDALAAILFGDVNPSGKLPCTFPMSLKDSPADALGAYPGTHRTEIYKEGLLVGYRWYDTKEIKPLFPFGYGLSYTTFKYSDMRIIPGDRSNVVATVEFQVRNTGLRAGAEVSQLYVHQENPTEMRPEKELKAFRRIYLEPNEVKTVRVPLDLKAFAFYNVQKHAWTAEKGSFDLIIGSSSRDIRLSASFGLLSGGQFL